MRSRTWKLVRLVAPVGLIPLFACLAPPVESPSTKVTQETSVRVEQNLKNKVDLLFMVDDSLSMAPKQQQLQARFPLLIKALDDFAAKGTKAWYHIGVVDSDLGAGPVATGGCTPGGDGGKLNITPKASTQGPPPAVCSGFGLSGGVRFIDYNQIAGTNNITGGLSVPDAFSCIASVGDQGCGFEHQLESAYKALHDNIAENAGFLRPDSILAVVFVTDEDDCSADPNTDLFGMSTTQNSMYGPQASFRCTQFGVMCNGQLVPNMSMPGTNGCVPAPNPMNMGPGKLFDVSRYINFFTGPAAQGGVRVNPDDVILVGIDAPQDPVGVTITSTGCPMGFASCPVLNHSCISNIDPKFFGDPAVRVNAVVSAAKHNNLTQICDTDYTAAMQQLGNLIISQIGAGCLNAPVAQRADNTPDCVVEDVTSNPDGSTTTKEIPSCAENSHMTPCWQLVNKVTDYNNGMCYQSPVPQSCMLPASCQPVPTAAALSMGTTTADCQGTGMPASTTNCELTTVTIDRGPGGMPPPNTTAHVSCATIASVSK